jgi:hypothetical protein
MEMKFYRHEIYKNEIYSDCGNYRIVGRRVYGNEFDYQPYRLKRTQSVSGFIVEGWQKLGKPTNLEEARKQCKEQ